MKLSAPIKVETKVHTYSGYAAKYSATVQFRVPKPIVKPEKK